MGITRVNSDNIRDNLIVNADISGAARIDPSKIAAAGVTSGAWSNLSGLQSKAVGISDTNILTNKTITGSSDVVASKYLVSSTALVSINSTTPTSGQQLTATSSSTATWQTPVNTGVVNLASANFIWNEVPYGTIDGSNLLFRTRYVPVNTGTVRVQKNGMSLRPGPSGQTDLWFSDASGNFYFDTGRVPLLIDRLCLDYLTSGSANSDFISLRGFGVNYTDTPDTYWGMEIPPDLLLDIATKDFGICGWMRIKGGVAGGNRGQVPFTVCDNAGIEITFIDETYASGPTWSMTSFNTDGTVERVGSWAPVTNEDWFYAMTWNFTAQRWTYYAGKDQNSLVGFTGRPSNTITTIDEIRIGSQYFGNYGNNTEHTNVKVWYAVEPTSGDLVSEMHSADPVTNPTYLWAHWKLLNSTDVTDYSAHGHDLSIFGTGVITNGTMDPVDIH